MKKFISVMLAVIMTFSLMVPAFARRTGSDLKSSVPVIYIAGDSNELFYDNETKSFAIDDMLSIFKNAEGGSVFEAAFNILYPLIVKGFLNDDWDDYYDAVYKELSDVYNPIHLDENGNVWNDCSISSEQKADLQDAMTYDRADEEGKYQEKTYKFHYDWRLDPIELADSLHEYIEGVKKASGHDKVSISVRCLGSNVVLAYVNKYGTDSLKGIGFDVSTSLGADFLSGMISGKFGIDGNAIARFVADLAGREPSEDSQALLDFAASTVNLMTNTGVIGKITDYGKEVLYSKIEYGIISALARATYLTFPGYWAVVSPEDFDDALDYVFGKKGDSKRDTYKGLIEKITVYNETIKKNAYPIMQTIKDSDTNVALISKYSIQLVPTIKDGSVLGDEYVAAAKSSFGATTASVYGTLSDEYIAERTEAGFGKYISPDKKIDASTCLFPDNTWFFKGVPHGFYTNPETDIMMTVMDADRQLTVNDFELTQFVVYDYPNYTAYPMTTENCNIENWNTDSKVDKPQNPIEKLYSLIKSCFNWFKSLFKLFPLIFAKKA